MEAFNSLPEKKIKVVVEREAKGGLCVLKGEYYTNMFNVVILKHIPICKMKITGKESKQ